MRLCMVIPTKRNHSSSGSRQYRQNFSTVSKTFGKERPAACGSPAAIERAEGQLSTHCGLVTATTVHAPKPVIYAASRNKRSLGHPPEDGPVGSGTLRPQLVRKR